jgi:hypothetical protein
MTRDNPPAAALLAAPKPCPPDAFRLRFPQWVATGLVPYGVAPCAVAAAYVRRFGVQPRRDPAKRSARFYSLGELMESLAELGLRLLNPYCAWL